jgi:hypothetical protein
VSLFDRPATDKYVETKKKARKKNCKHWKCLEGKGSRDLNSMIGHHDLTETNRRKQETRLIELKKRERKGNNQSMPYSMKKP